MDILLAETDPNVVSGVTTLLQGRSDAMLILFLAALGVAAWAKWVYIPDRAAKRAEEKQRLEIQETQAKTLAALSPVVMSTHGYVEAGHNQLQLLIHLEGLWLQALRKIDRDSMADRELLAIEAAITAWRESVVKKGPVT